jgi:hypothetical protein
MPSASGFSQRSLRWVSLFHLHYPIDRLVDPQGHAGTRIRLRSATAGIGIGKG